MNKSKFLKKSLAAILSVLLVVAMIPLSAAASAVVSVVTINDTEATLSGDTYSAVLTSPSTAPTVKVTLANGAGTIEHDDENGNNDADALTTADGTWTFTMTAEEFENRTATFRVYDDSETTDVTATYKVTYTVKDGAEDDGVASVTVSGQYGATEVDGTTYTVTMPYGTTTLTSNIRVVLNDENATVSGVTGATSPATKVKNGTYDIAGATVGTDVTFTVIAEDGVHTQDYTIKLQTAAAFTSFSVEGQRKDAEIDADNKEITVYMPFGTASSSTGKWQFTPVFETVYPSATVTATKTVGSTVVTIKSGNEVELSEFTTAALGNNASIDTATTSTTKIVLNVKYTGGTEPWTVNFATPQNDPEPVLKGLRVKNYAGVIDEENHTVSLSLPAAERVVSGTVSLLASANVKVLPVEANITTAWTMTGGTTWDSNTLDLTKDKYTLRVTAAGNEDGEDAATKKVQDYILTISTAEESAPEIVEMILEDLNGEQYTASISDNGTILFKVPYSITNNGTYTVIDGKAALVNWKLYYKLSSGAACSALVALPSGVKLANNEAIMPTVFDGKTVDGTALQVLGSDSTYKTYQIAVEQGKPSTAATMTGFTITTEDTDFDKVEVGENAFAATGSKDFTVNVPYSKYTAFDAAIVSAVLPAGAALYYVDSDDSDTLVEVEVLTETTNAAITKKLPSIASYEYDGKEHSGKVTPLELVVISESGDAAADALVSGGGNTLGTDFVKDDLSTLPRGSYATYTLSVKQDAAKTAAKLDEFNVYDAATKTTIKGVVMQSPAGITLTLPYGYDTAATDSLVNELYLDWSSSNYETIDLQEDDVSGYQDLQNDTIDPIKLTSDGEVDEGDEVVFGTTAAPALQLATSPNDTVTAVKVTSEDTNKSVTYPLTIKFEKEKTDAKLNSVTINNVRATPDANNKVTINLPMGTEITALKPAFVVSDGAFVSSVANKDSNFNDTYVITDGTQMNFTAPKTVYVYSENARNMTTYTIEVKLADTFSDVPEGIWFYDSVMEAYNNGIIAGRGNGIFDPYGSVTRAEFATMIARVDGFDKDAEITNPFSDMQGYTGEVYNAVAYCADKGYITGYGDTTFKPGNIISRQEMAVIICRVLGLSTEDVTVEAPFADDAKIAGWAKDYVYACVNEGMLLGEGGNTFNPLGSTNRAAAATVAVRVDHAK